ncbi:hypothetical protein CEUSTIGMA_g923.t1 [Chlamydomonas eustigma]|uniref:Uncharacterized protein n=1 Tax=Chlamydomonas eustigma TaxID=1157962 RepID=A0A250WRP7_9CHLO|nr:hypothetical protein CEUSTIGMA_g923.t1 [Chlamydomonas eustigma]|eukprot:GAX73471.1 hypothetical protein CEUSTIGMA_g923.t1 [Chlamydomonas eustigma]
MSTSDSHRMAALEAALRQAEAEVAERELAYSVAIQEFEAQRSVLTAELQSKDVLIQRWQAEEASIQNERLQVEQRNMELKNRQDRIEELQKSVQALVRERDELRRLVSTKDEIIASSSSQVAQLQLIRDQLNLRVAELEEAVKDVDTKKRLELLQTQYEQTQQFMKSKVEFLEKELETKGRSLLEQNMVASAESLSLRQRLSSLEYEKGLSEALSSQLQERVKDLESALQESRRETSTVEGRLVDAEEHYNRQTARYLTMVDEAVKNRDEKARELEAMQSGLAAISSDVERSEVMQQQMQAASEEQQSAYQEVVKKLRDELSALKQAIRSAVGSGKISTAVLEDLVVAMTPGGGLFFQGAPTDGVNQDEPGTPNRGVSGGPEEEGLLPPGSAVPPGSTPGLLLSQGRGHAELYRKYTEVHDAWIDERGKVRRLEGYLEQIAVEIKAKASSLERERTERESLAQTCTALQDSIQQLTEGRSQLEQQMNRMTSECERMEREKTASEQAAKDLQQQVAQLLTEVQRLRGDPLPPTSTYSTPGSSGVTGNGYLSAEQLTSSDQPLNSSDVISSRLVTYRSVSELIEQNRRLLSLVRQLSAENERSKSEVRVELRSEWQAQEAVLQSEAAEQRHLIDQLTKAAEESTKYITALKTQMAELQQQVSTLRGGDTSTGREESGSPAGAPSGLSSEAVEALQRELSTTREEAGRIASELQAQVSDLREKLVTASSEAQHHARHLVDSERRVSDLSAQLATEQKQLQVLTMDRARAEGLHQSLQHRLVDMKMQVEELQAKVSEQSHRCVVLEADVGVTRSSLDRANAELTALGNEKARLTVELLTEQKAAKMSTESHRLAMEEQHVKVSALETELARLKASYDTQQTLFHDSISAANRQVASSREDLETVRKDKVEVETLLNGSKQQVQEQQVTILTLEAKISELTATVTEMKEALEACGKAAEEEVRAARIRELEAGLLAADVEVTNAKEALAAKQEQVSVYRSNLDSLQQQLEMIRSDKVLSEQQHAEALAAAAAAKASSETQLAAVQSELDDLKTQKQVLEDELALQGARAAAIEKELRDGNYRLQTDIADHISRMNEAHETSERLRTQVRDYRQRFENEITEHARDVGALREMESQLDEAKDEVNRLQAEVHRARGTAGEVVSQQASERAELERRLATSEARVSELVEAQNLMTKEMARVLGGTTPELVGMSSDTYKELMDYLSRDKAMAAMQLELLGEERNRLRAERDNADRTAAELRAQYGDMQTSMQRGRQDLQARIDELKAEAQVRTTLLGQVQGDLSATRISLHTCQQALSTLQQESRNLRAHASSLEAEAAGHKVALEGHKRGEAMWLAKYNNLLEKYGKVTLDEYQAVQAQLASAQAQLADQDSRLADLQSLTTQLQEARDQVEASKQQVAGKDAEIKAKEEEMASLKADKSKAVISANNLVRKVKSLKEELTAKNKEAEDSKAEIERLEEEKQKLQRSGAIKQIKELTAKLEAVSAELAALQKQVQITEKEKEKLQAEHIQLQSDHQKLKADEQKLQLQVKAGGQGVTPAQRQQILKLQENLKRAQADLAAAHKELEAERQLVEDFRKDAEQYRKLKKAREEKASATAAGLPIKKAPILEASGTASKAPVQVPAESAAAATAAAAAAAPLPAVLNTADEKTPAFPAARVVAPAFPAAHVVAPATPIVDTDMTSAHDSSTPADVPPATTAATAPSGTKRVAAGPAPGIRPAKTLTAPASSRPSTPSSAPANTQQPHDSTSVTAQAPTPAAAAVDASPVTTAAAVDASPVTTAAAVDASPVTTAAATSAAALVPGKPTRIVKRPIAAASGVLTIPEAAPHVKIKVASTPAAAAAAATSAPVVEPEANPRITVAAAATSAPVVAPEANPRITAAATAATSAPVVAPEVNPRITAAAAAAVLHEKSGVADPSIALADTSEDQSKVNASSFAAAATTKEGKEEVPKPVSATDTAPDAAAVTTAETASTSTASEISLGVVASVPPAALPAAPKEVTAAADPAPAALPDCIAIEVAGPALEPASRVTTLGLVKEDAVPRVHTPHQGDQEPEVTKGMKPSAELTSIHHQPAAAAAAATAAASTAIPTLVPAATQSNVTDQVEAAVAEASDADVAEEERVSKPCAENDAQLDGNEDCVQGDADQNASVDDDEQGLQEQLEEDQQLLKEDEVEEDAGVVGQSDEELMEVGEDDGEKNTVADEAAAVTNEAAASAAAAVAAAEEDEGDVDGRDAEELEEEEGQGQIDDDEGEKEDDLKIGEAVGEEREEDMLESGSPGMEEEPLDDDDTAAAAAAEPEMLITGEGEVAVVEMKDAMAEDGKGQQEEEEEEEETMQVDIQGAEVREEGDGGEDVLDAMGEEQGDGLIEEALQPEEIEQHQLVKEETMVDAAASTASTAEPVDPGLSDVVMVEEGKDKDDADMADAEQEEKVMEEAEEVREVELGEEAEEDMIAFDEVEEEEQVEEEEEERVEAAGAMVAEGEAAGAVVVEGEAAGAVVAEGEAAGAMVAEVEAAGAVVVEGEAAGAVVAEGEAAGAIVAATPVAVVAAVYATEDITEAVAEALNQDGEEGEIMDGTEEEEEEAVQGTEDEAAGGKEEVEEEEEDEDEDEAMIKKLEEKAKAAAAAAAKKSRTPPVSPPTQEIVEPAAAVGLAASSSLHEAGSSPTATQALQSSVASIVSPRKGIPKSQLRKSEDQGGEGSAGGIRKKRTPILFPGTAAAAAARLGAPLVLSSETVEPSLVTGAPGPGRSGAVLARGRGGARDAGGMGRVGRPLARGRGGRS